MMTMAIITFDRGDRDRAMSYSRLLPHQRQPATWLSTHYYSVVELDFAPVPSCDSVGRRNCQMLVADLHSEVLALQSVKTSSDCSH